MGKIYFHVSVLHHQFIKSSNETFVWLKPRLMSSYPIAAFWLLFQTPEVSAHLLLWLGPSHFWWWSGCCHPWSPHGPETRPGFRSVNTAVVFFFRFMISSLIFKTGRGKNTLLQFKLNKNVLQRRNKTWQKTAFKVKYYKMH